MCFGGMTASKEVVEGILRGGVPIVMEED